MKNRFRQPMFWVVLLEVGLLFALFAVSWRVYQAQRPGAGASAASPAAAAPSPVAAAPPSPRPASPHPTPRSAAVVAPPVGFPVDLAQLNRDQAGLERAETRVLMAIVSTARNYLDRVVVPAVVRAERAARATSPAVTQRPAAIVKMP